MIITPYEKYLKDLSQVHPRDRIAHVEKNLDIVSKFTSYELDQVGLLICAASSKKMRKAYPIFGCKSSLDNANESGCYIEIKNE